MNTRSLARSILLAGSVCAFAAQAAEDYTIATGENETFSTSGGNYGDLTINGTLTLADNVVVTAKYVKCTVDSTNAEARLCLKPGSRLVATEKWIMNGSGTLRTRFEGGTISFQQVLRYDAGTNIFEAVDGNNINLHVTKWNSYVLYNTNTAPRIYFTGNGGLVKTGENNQYMNDWHQKIIDMDYTGDTWINEGAVNLQGCNFPAKTALHLAQGTYLGLCGNYVYLGSIDGDGYISEVDSNHPLLIFAGDGDSDMTALDCISARIEKGGRGTMTIAPRGSMDGLAVNTGKVVLKSRAEAGYMIYRYKIDECRGVGTTWDATQMGEFYLYAPDGTEITNLRTNDKRASFSDGWIECLYDRTAKTKWFTNVKRSSSASDKEKCYFDVVFPRVKQVTSYLWGTAWDCPRRDPSAWRMLASVGSTERWTTLATVTNFAATTTRDADAAPTNFVLNLPKRVVVPTLTVAKGASLEVAANTELYTTNPASLNYCAVSVGSGGAFILDPQKDVSAQYLRLDGAGELRKEGDKTVSLFGAATGLTGPIHVAGGTLKLTGNHTVPAKAFKFTFTKNAWKVTWPEGDWSANEIYRTIQFGEIALYDKDFNRVSVTTNLAYNSGGYAAGSLFDGDTVSSCYYNALHTGSYSIIIELKPDVASWVTGYRFHPETKYGGVFDKTPAEWTVSVAETRNGPWTVVDQRLCKATNASSGWNSWQGGVPFAFTNDMTTAAFAATCPVQVDAGATLDVSDSATTVSALTVDCSQSGTGRLVGGTLAATGTIALVNVSGKVTDMALPLTLEGTTLPAALDGWSVTVNGQVKKNWRLMVRDGRLAVVAAGFLLIVR